MICKEFEARISALIDDELSADARIEVLEHIAQCPACKAHWEACLAMRDALREETHAPCGFAEGVMARVRETAQDRPAEKKVLRFPGWKRFAGLAACCAVIAVGAWIMGGSPEQTMSNSDVSNRGLVPAMTAGQECPDSVAEFDVADGVDSYGMDDTESCQAPYDRMSGVEDSYSAVMITSSKLAEEWVEQRLGGDWVSGACYSINEEMYNELRTLLMENGESFSEIMGDENSSGYLLLAG